ncbi:regulatory protein spx [Scopulibacillus darangshiensis]|uniref:Regulatory protein spx n=1 Tax=Scopulibacillus darangshiensis TaxID=442528 RepID=A0A4R2P851_9BACL|nr:Spx/MgsR family RNA polymerase-binding regulatory protein [Scopulibacillus darangshiensis]TCP31149.1 regulatory protein spx [Scopulibacillus darangshiensis]
MGRLTFFTYPSCTSCRKAKFWLNENNINYEERHLFKETPDVKELMNIIKLTRDGLSEILATRSETYKQLNVNIDDLPLSEGLKLLSDEPKLLRRPIITDGKRLIVGYNQSGLVKLSEHQKDDAKRVS